MPLLQIQFLLFIWSSGIAAISSSFLSVTALLEEMWNVVKLDVWQTIEGRVS